MLVNVVRTETLTAGDHIFHEDQEAELVFAPVWEPLQDSFVVTLWFPAERKHETVQLATSTRKVVAK